MARQRGMRGLFRRDAASAVPDAGASERDLQHFRGQERVWMDLASRLFTQRGGEFTAAEESSFFVRSYRTGQFSITETAGVTPKGATSAVLTAAGRDRLFCAYINAAGAGSHAALLTSRVSGIVRGVLSSSLLDPIDLRRIALVANADLSGRNLLGRFVAMAAWIVDLRTGILSAVDCGDIDLVLEHTDGRVRRVEFPDVAPFGIIENELGEEAYPRIFEIPISNVQGCFVLDDGLIDAVSAAWSDPDDDSGPLEFAEQVFNAAYRRKTLEVPVAMRHRVATSALRFDRCGSSVSLFEVLQAAAATISLRLSGFGGNGSVPQSIDAPDLSYSTLDTRMARVIRCIAPDVSFQEIDDGVSVLEDYSLDPGLALTSVRAVWQAVSRRYRSAGPVRPHHRPAPGPLGRPARRR